MKAALRYFTVLLLMVGSVHSQTQVPQCFSNYTPPVGHGFKNDDPNQGPRTILNVWVDPALNNNVHAAVTTATERWNAATNSAGTVVPYYFNVVVNEANADVRVVAGTSTHGCSNYNLSTREMRIDTGLADNSAASIADVVAHELGHPLGLNNDTSVTPGTTVMQGFTGDCDTLTDSIRPNDVDQVIRQATDRSTCTSTVQTSAEFEPLPTPTPSSSCPDTCPNPQAYFPATCFGGVDYCRYPQTGCESGLEANGRCCCSANTPIVIDILGDGFSLTNAADGVDFDLSAIGVKSRVSWISTYSDDVFLTLDRNGNGLIDDGTELFGNVTPQQTPPIGVPRNGFLALAEYDELLNGGNSDGVIDHNDAVFDSLRLWRDVNHNGTSEITELYRLSDLNVAALSLDFKESRRRDTWGNAFRYRAHVYGASSMSVGRWAYDVLLLESR